MSPQEIAPGGSLSSEQMEVVLAVRAGTIERGGNFWIELAGDSIRPVADLFKRLGARLVAITARSDGEGESRLSYHFDVDGAVYSVILRTTGNEISSIADIFPGADWSQREAADLYGVAFGGQPASRPLLLRED